MRDLKNSTEVRGPENCIERLELWINLLNMLLGVWSLLGLLFNLKLAIDGSNLVSYLRSTLRLELSVAMTATRCFNF